MSIKRLGSIWTNWPGFILTAIMAASLGLLLVGDNQRAVASQETPDAPQTADAYVFLTPEGGGNCAAPVNGGTTTVGCRFVLGLMLNAGSHNGAQPGGGVTALQSYLTFTTALLRVANVSGISTNCVVTKTLTADLTVFDAELQNETCNGPPDTSSNCIFRNWSVPAGSIGFASMLLTSPHCPNGCPNPNEVAPWNQPVMRLARMGLCASAPGQAVLHWQFTPPAPITRDSEIVILGGDLIQTPALYQDYVINIISAPEATLVGHVTWQGRPAQPNALQQLPAALILKSGAVEVDYPLQNTDANGNFTVNVTGLSSGTYDWWVKGPKFLARAGTFEYTGATSTNLEMVVLSIGDSNNDNVVNISDFMIVRSAFGSTIGDPTYDDRADLNGDHIVSVTDVNQTKMNFGLSGAAAP